MESNQIPKLGNNLSQEEFYEKIVTKQLEAAQRQAESTIRVAIATENFHKAVEEWKTLLTSHDDKSNDLRKTASEIADLQKRICPSCIEAISRIEKLYSSLEKVLQERFSSLEGVLREEFELLKEVANTKKDKLTYWEKAVTPIVVTTISSGSVILTLIVQFIIKLLSK